MVFVQKSLYSIMSAAPNIITIHQQLNEARKLNRISYNKMGACISYSGEGVNKALKNGTLSLGQISTIIKSFDLKLNIDNFDNFNETINPTNSTDILSQCSPEEICVYIFENRERFKDNPVYKMLLDNEIKSAVIEELEKHKQRIKARK